MLSVSALSAYLFCKRKMYMQYVLEAKPIEVDRIVKGEIKHNVFDRVNKKEEEIVKMINIQNLNEAGTLYKQEYYKALMETIEQKEEVIRRVGINKMELLEEAWTRLLQEAEIRANNIKEFAEQNQVFGNELWEGLRPKYITELSIASRKLKLRGRIDRVEVDGENYTPIELKTGKMPINGIWAGDRMQIGAYILLMQGKYKTEHGFLEYVTYGARKKIIMDEKLKEEIISLVEEVHDTIKSKYLPRKCGNERKCITCQIREICDEMKMEYANEEEQESYEDHETSYIT